MSLETFEVKVALQSAALPVSYLTAYDTYVKAGMFVVAFIHKDELLVHRYPLDHLHKVEEKYPIGEPNVP